MSATRVYAYGCLPAVENADKVREQVFLAHRYKNKLIEIARKDIADYRAIRAKHAPDLAALETSRAEIGEALDALDVEYKKRRQAGASVAIREAKQRGKSPARPKRSKYPDLDEQIERLKSERKIVNERWRHARDAFNATLAEASAAFKQRVEEQASLDGYDADNIPPRSKEKYNVLVLADMLADEKWPAAWRAIETAKKANRQSEKEARAACGVSFGTYLLVEAAADQARKDAESPDGPMFQRFTGEGAIGVQLREGGLTVKDFESGESNWLRCRVIRRDACAASNGRRAHVRHALVDIRIGSEGVKPVWATFPVVLHRELPHDAIIKVAKVVFWRQGPRLKSELQLTLTMSDGVSRAHRADSGAVALHLAWRKVEGGIRVGYLMGDDGSEEKIVMPVGSDDDGKDKGVIGRQLKSEALRSTSDEFFDVAKDALRARLSCGGLPEWLVEATEHIHAWNAHGKLAKVTKRWAEETSGASRIADLWEKWKAERLPTYDLFASQDALDRWFMATGVADADHRLALYLEWWRRKDWHLETWQADNRAKALARRKNDRRVLAARLSRRFKTLLVEKTDLREAAKRAAPTEEEKLHADARTQRQRVCPSELRDVLRQAFGDDVVEMGAVSASECATCGGSFAVGDDEVIGRCENGHEEDRDRNACRLMLRRGGVASGGGDAPNAGGARGVESAEIDGKLRAVG